MTLRKRNLHFLLIGVLGLLAPAATARAQAIVVTARSASELADDLEYLIKSVAPDDDPMARAALDALKNFKSGAMIKGLDRGRGFGLAVTLPADFPGGRLSLGRGRGAGLGLRAVPGLAQEPRAHGRR